ncbi:MAG: ATPase, T2SS/T4P/T4SS family [Patescibacteria group bacterium]|nr:ATPase, T2SS/T4P/T4SS family [Patescibacteria group bacterium]
MIITESELQQLLVSAKVLDEKQFAEIQNYCRNANLPLFRVLVREKNVITDEKLGELIAAYIKLPYVRLTKQSIPQNVLQLVPETFSRRQKVVPFARTEQSVRIAFADPRNPDLIAMLQKKIGCQIEVFYATDQDIADVHHLYKKDLQKAVNKMLVKAAHLSNSKNFESVSVIKIVDMIIDYAYQDKASDIHMEPQEENFLIRYRIDGILHDVLFLPKSLQERILTRIKVLSRLRTDEHLAAQDGKIRTKILDEYLDIRVSIIPIVDGEKVVMRLLTSQNDQLSLSDLGMSQADLQKLTNAFNKSYGMILSTGPTGSGKSTTIYAILRILNVREKNITTIEDPVEYRVKGLNQIQVNQKTNLTFAQGLRSILRQDPNIVFVGEIRDTETAGIAVNAALTGHLVFSTLHTNDAPTALPRLTDMKVEPFLVASTVSVIVAQRLVRKICNSCRTAIGISRQELLKNIPEDVVKKYFGNSKDIELFYGKGCKICHQSGYFGRMGVYEVLEVTREIRRLIIQKADSDVILDQARKEGMTTMLEDGIDKAKRGVTTLEEVLRVTKTENV